jgi:hypothetical protein
MDSLEFPDGFMRPVPKHSPDALVFRYGNFDDRECTMQERNVIATYVSL